MYLCLKSSVTCSNVCKVALHASDTFDPWTAGVPQLWRRACSIHVNHLMNETSFIGFGSCCFVFFAFGGLELWFLLWYMSPSKSLAHPEMASDQLTPSWVRPMPAALELFSLVC